MNVGGDQRKQQTDLAPRRRYADVKAASSTAAERIARASADLVSTFREAYAPEYDRPRAALALVDCVGEGQG